MVAFSNKYSNQKVIDKLLLPYFSNILVLAFAFCSIKFNNNLIFPALGKILALAKET